MKLDQMESIEEVDEYKDEIAEAIDEENIISGYGGNICLSPNKLFTFRCQLKSEAAGTKALESPQKTDEESFKEKGESYQSPIE